MPRKRTSTSAKVRATLDHPIIDADGHLLELNPLFNDFLLDFARRAGGSRLAAKFEKAGDLTYQPLILDPWYRLTPEERRDRWVTGQAWWVLAGKTLDRATASLPALLNERLDEFGLAYTILYPTNGLTVNVVDDEELRRVGSRALNAYHAEIYRPYAERMTPVAVIPTHNPQEAIEEVRYAVQTLGLKVITMGPAWRPVAKILREAPAAAGASARWDPLALDSDYDYDPLWAACMELGVAPTFHTGSRGSGTRRSPTNFSYNHIGHFAAGCEAICKALFIGGVTRRFPQLNFAFLEGGVAWACSLYASLIGEWAKRNPKAIQQFNPANLDLDLLTKLIRSHGSPLAKERVEDLLTFFKEDQRRPWVSDDWAANPMKKAEEVRELFVPRFFFGCEADDPTTAWAFDNKVNPFNARLQAILGSDIGHYDVPDMTTILEEAHELVERRLLTQRDFKEFTFSNAVKLHAGMNPHFFDGTTVETAARKELARLAGSH